MIDVIMESELSTIYNNEQHIIISMEFKNRPMKGNKLIGLKVGGLHQKKYLEDMYVISLDLLSRLVRAGNCRFNRQREYEITNNFDTLIIDDVSFKIIDTDSLYYFKFMDGPKGDPVRILKQKKGDRL